MAVKTVTTTLTVSFDSGEGDGLLTAEIDDREDGLNNGDTSFAPGDPVYFLVFKSENVVILAIEASLGAVTTVGAVTKAVEEQFNFEKPENLEQSLKYPYDGGGSVQWIGKTLGSAVFSGNEIKVSPSGTSKYGAGVLRVNYNSNGTAYKLTHTPLQDFTEYDINILIVGEATV